MMPNDNSNILMIFFIIALVLLIISCIAFYFHKIKTKKTSQETNLNVRSNPQITQSNIQYISSISQNVTIDDPPPSYPKDSLLKMNTSMARI
jgi:hypothetical protein